MENKIFKKIRKEKLQIFLLSIILTVVGILIVFNILFLYLNKNDSGYYDDKNNHYEKVAKYYQDDLEVLKVVERCQDPAGQKGIIYNTTIECVYFNIPFNYDRNRAKNNPGGTLSPSEMIEKKGKGVCRDIAVFRKIVLNSLNIESIFVFEPGHVYIVAFESGETYELNNEFLIKH